MKFYGNGCTDSSLDSYVWATLNGEYWIQIVRENRNYELFNKKGLLGTFNSVRAARGFAVNYEVKKMAAEYVAEKKLRNA